MQKRTVCCAGLVVFAWVVGLAQAQSSLTHLIVNPSFENPAFIRTAPDELLFTHRPNDGPGAVPGWTTPNVLMGIVELTGTADPVNDFPPGADDGNNALWINAVGDATQVLPQIIVSGDTYTLTVALGTRQSNAPNHYRVDLLADGVPVATDDNSLAPLPTPATWQDMTVVYNAPPTDAGKRLGIRLSVPIMDGVQTLFDDLELTTSGSEVIELLVNNDFTLPAIPGAAPGVCPGKDDGPVDDWNESGPVARNDTVCGNHVCPPTDGTYLTLTQTASVWQTVPNSLLSSGTEYNISAAWQLANVLDEGTMTSSIEVYRGDSPSGSPIASISDSLTNPPGSCNDQFWTPATFNFTTPGDLGSDNITVVIKNEAPGCCFYLLHMDYISLTLGPQANIEVNSITPAFGVRDTTVNVSISGSNFSTERQNRTRWPGNRSDKRRGEFSHQPDL